MGPVRYVSRPRFACCMAGPERTSNSTSVGIILLAKYNLLERNAQDRSGSGCDMAVSSESLHQADVVEIEVGAAPNDPWAELNVAVTAPDGHVVTVPAFIRDGRWRFRYSSETVGTHRFETLAAVDGTGAGDIEVAARIGSVAGLAHGAVQISADGRHFEHVDGTPFLWVGDTWWHGFVTEKISDDEFRDFAARRAAQGYSVVQIVALAPEAGPFDEAVKSRAGWPWQVDFVAPNLHWWDDADSRIEALVDAGLVPCIVGSWGYHFAILDNRQMHRHWREMVARWAAYPIVWCLSGEPTLALYEDMLTVTARLEREANGEEISRAAVIQVLEPVIQVQLALFNRIAHALPELDPFDRLTTTHVYPGEMPWEILDDESTVDFWMLQTGHAGFNDLANAVDAVNRAYDHAPVKPVLNGEPSYEGIAGSSWEDVQRFQFWSHLLSGAAGHTYGAHGVWAMNTPEFPGQYSGLAPSWKEASEFTGGRDVGAGASWLRTLDWHAMRPNHDLVTPHQTTENRLAAYAAEFPDGSRLVYLPSRAMASGGTSIRFEELGDTPWTANYVSPRNGEVFPEFTLQPSTHGSARLRSDAGQRPSWEDWLIVARVAS